MSQPIFFAKLEPSKKDELLALMSKSGLEFVVKMNDQYFRSKILRENGLASYSLFRFTYDIFNHRQANCSLEIKDGRYFFRATLNSTSTDLTMDVPNEIMQLQRRNDFRVSLPPGAGYLCEIVRVNAAKKRVPAELRNLSLGGCQIALKEADLDLMQNAEIALRIQIKEFEAESIPAIAKHVRAADENGIVIVGIQFTEPQADFLSDLQGVLMYLDRTHRIALNS